jgi:hypothetical protein
VDATALFKDVVMHVELDGSANPAFSEKLLEHCMDGENYWCAWRTRRSGRGIDLPWVLFETWLIEVGGTHEASDVYARLTAVLTYSCFLFALPGGEARVDEVTGLGEINGHIQHNDTDPSGSDIAYLILCRITSNTYSSF